MIHPIINVVLVDLKVSSGYEIVTENEDGTFTILINSRQAHNKQMEAYLHALKHILNDDFRKDDVQLIESTAHKKERIQRS